MDQEPTQQPQTPEVEQNQREASRRGLPWVCWLAILPLVYVLSIGPALKVWPPRMFPRKAFVVYHPLEWLADHSRPFDRFLRWYTYDLWHCKLYE